MGNTYNNPNLLSTNKLYMMFKYPDNPTEQHLGSSTHQAEVRDLIAQIRGRSTSIKEHFKPTN